MYTFWLAITIFFLWMLKLVENATEISPITSGGYFPIHIESSKCPLKGALFSCMQRFVFVRGNFAVDRKACTATIKGLPEAKSCKHRIIRNKWFFWPHQEDIFQPPTTLTVLLLINRHFSFVVHKCTMWQSRCARAHASSYRNNHTCYFYDRQLWSIRHEL